MPTSSGSVRLPHSVRSERFLYGLTSVFVFAVLWELAGRLRWVNPLFISYPSQVVQEGWLLLKSPLFAGHVWVSLIEFGTGFGIAIALGVPLGLAIGRFRRLDLLVEPLLTALYTTPRLALLPLFIIWMGIGIYSKAAIVFLGAFFPIVVNMMIGIKEINRIWVQAARSFGAGELAIFIKVMLPGSLPYMFTGLRIGLGRGLLGVIIAEMYVSAAGVGYLLIQSGQAFRTGRVMFLVVCISGFGLALIGLIQTIERRVVRWRNEVQEE